MSILVKSVKTQDQAGERRKKLFLRERNIFVYLLFPGLNLSLSKIQLKYIILKYNLQAQ